MNCSHSKVLIDAYELGLCMHCEAQLIWQQGQWHLAPPPASQKKPKKKSYRPNRDDDDD